MPLRRGCRLCQPITPLVREGRAQLRCLICRRTPRPLRPRVQHHCLVLVPWGHAIIVSPPAESHSRRTRSACTPDFWSHLRPNAENYTASSLRTMVRALGRLLSTPELVWSRGHETTVSKL